MSKPTVTKPLLGFKGLKKRPLKPMKEKFDNMDKVIIATIVIISLLGWSQRTEAAPYIDLGVGYMDGVEIQFDTPFGSILATAPAGTGYLMARIGYEYNGWHVEMQATGLPESYFQTFSTYYRWGF